MFIQLRYSSDGAAADNNDYDDDGWVGDFGEASMDYIYEGS